jgi:hypothetical protein
MTANTLEWNQLLDAARGGSRVGTWARKETVREAQAADVEKISATCASFCLGSISYGQANLLNPVNP